MNENSQHPPEENDRQELTGREAYNRVTDTVGGLNIRWKDNLYQFVAITLCTVIGAGIGSQYCPLLMGGVLQGAFIGMVIGFLASGFFLMIYRGVKQLRGQHK